MQVKDPDISRIVEKIGDHFQNNVSNRFVRKALVTLDLQQSEWDRLEGLTAKSDYYKQNGFTFDDLYEMMLAAAHFIQQARQRLLPNIRGMLAHGSTEKDRILRDMAAQNFGANLTIFSDLVNELYQKTVALDRSFHGKNRPEFERIPELKDLGRMLVNES